MKFAKIAWVMGGVVAVGLGMGAQACSSSSTSASTGTGSSSTGGSGTSTTGAPATMNCAALSTCCATLAGTSAAPSCATGLAAAAGNEGECATFLAMVQAQKDCLGVSTTGSSTGTGPTVTTTGGSPTGSTPTGGVTTTTGGNSTTQGSVSTSSGECKAPRLFPEAKAGVYCPFTVNDGGHTYCDPPQACVEPYGDGGAYPPSYCGANTVMNATVIECLEAIDCTGVSGKPVCCGFGTITPEPACNDAGAYNKVSKFGGTSCESACMTGFTICQAPTDCTSGQTCVPSSAYGNDFGICTSP